MAEDLSVATESFQDVLSEIGRGELRAESFSRLRRAACVGDGPYDARAALEDWKSAASDVDSENRTTLQGFCQFVLGDIEAAASTLSKDKASPWSAYYLIRVELGRQRHEAALKLIDAALKQFSGFRPLEFLAVEVYCKNRCEEQALDRLNALKTEFDGTSEYEYYLGLYKERHSEYADAIVHYRKAVALDDENVHAWFRLALCIDMHGFGDEDSIDESIVAYEQCLEVEPPYTNALINLGVLYEDRERYHDAVKCYEAVLSSNPNHTRARLFLEDARASTRMFYDRDEEKKADRQSQVLKIPVTDFELSVRSRNCLQKMDIMTLGDLIMKTEQELLSYKNFGETSLKEIKDMLESKNLRLGQGLEQKATASAPRNPLEATADPGLLGKPIEELELSVRSRRCMERLGIKSLRDLINMTEVQLMSAKNFGMTSLNEIKRKLAEHNLKLRG